ncbi:MAG: hypothetical protein A4E19_05220 [Nitrospira sp. SG-bin1]|nr:MAG: hypothetical protein A4E19_05220 [Nitrospira sp. SG-bin1]
MVKMARTPPVKLGISLVVCLFGFGGCAADAPLDLSSFDPAHDQKAIAGYYRDQAVSMREKAHAQTTAAARFEALFGPEDDAVAGARSLAHYYEQTAQELERVAEAHAAVSRHGQRPQTVR